MPAQSSCHMLRRSLPCALSALSALLLLMLPTVASAQGATIDASQYIDAELADHGIQRAIDAAADAGGGTVQLPEGTFELRAGLVLRSGVTLQGAGMDKTILTPQRRVHHLHITESAVENKVQVDRIPEGLVVGSALVVSDRWPPSWVGRFRPLVVTAVDRDANTLTLESPYDSVDQYARRGARLIFGDAVALEQPIAKGDTEIHLRSAAAFAPGDEITIGQPDNHSMPNHAFVKEVRGNTLVLTEPAQVDFTVFPDDIGKLKYRALLWTLFPMIHAADLDNAGIRDLTVQGHGNFDTQRPAQTRYTLAGIHFYNVSNTTLERVAVRDWPTDGFSLQTGQDNAVLNCEATGNLGNGFHPGTGLKTTRFEDCLASHNGAGLYFCWHNRGHVLRNNQFTHNRHGGITGLGNPGDRDNLIENNVIAFNGGPGIVINGGKESGNVIRGNTIENNSQNKAGRHPGIALHASIENAAQYTIEGNTIRDTQETPTQYVGIDERHGERKGKPTYADHNVIRANTFTGHTTADLVLAGDHTVAEDNGEAKITRAADAEAAEADADAEE